MRPLVVVDADVLGRRRTGDESYVRGLLGAAAPLAAELELAAVTRHPELVPPGVRPLRVPGSSQALRLAVRLPALLRRLTPSVSHFQYVVPPRVPGRTVVTVHDLSFEYHPDFMPLHDRVAFRLLVPRAVRGADAVLTVSEWTRRDLVARYGIPEERVVVTPNGVDPSFTPKGPARRGPPYLLFVGALQPRKDPLTALRALTLLPQVRLLIAGEARGGYDLRRPIRSLGLERRVELLGHVEPADLPPLYRGAACLVFPSLFEGFGIPVLEAMACGCPVVASDATALPEVAGDAAVLVPPSDPEALADGVRRALDERERLIAAGLERARLFSWEETARRTLAVYRDLS